MEPDDELSFFDQVDFVKSFYYLGDRLNASGVSEAAETAKTRIEWIKFRECRPWGVNLWEKVFVKNERKDLSELRKISNAVWERDVVFDRE